MSLDDEHIKDELYMIEMYCWSALTWWVFGRHGRLPLTHLCRAMDGREQSDDVTLAEYSTSLQFPVVLAPCILHRFKVSSSRQSCHQVWLWISLPRTGAEATFTVANFTMIVGLFTLPCLFARHGWSTGNRHTIKGVNSMKGWMIPSRT